MKKSTGVKIAIAVICVLAIGFVVAIAEGLVPKTVRQALLVIFIAGPILLFGEALLEGLMEVMAYAIGRILLPVITFGKVRVERMSEQHSFPWHGARRLDDGTYVISGELSAIVVFVVAVAGIVAWVFFI